MIKCLFLDKSREFVRFSVARVKLDESRDDRCKSLKQCATMNGQGILLILYTVYLPGDSLEIPGVCTCMYIMISLTFFHLETLTKVIYSFARDDMFLFFGETRNTYDVI